MTMKGGIRADIGCPAAAIIGAHNWRRVGGISRYSHQQWGGVGDREIIIQLAAII